MAAKTNTDPKTLATDTVKVVEDMVVKAQEQYLTALTEGQDMALETYKAVTDSVAKLNLPSVPGLGDVYKVPATALDSMFDFGAALIENQRNFTKKVLETSQA